MPMDEQKLINLVTSEFENAMGAEGGEISKERAQAWDYYLAKHFGDEEEGQSQVVTSDVADVVDGIMPSLLRIFTTAENLVDFDPTGPEDEAQAEQESDYTNYVFFKKNPAFLILYTWFFDALVQKNGIVKAWWDDSETVTTETYEGLNDAELASLEADEELAVEESETRMGKTIAADGVTEIEARLHDVTFKRTVKMGQVRVENVPPEEFRISNDARSLVPDGARMVGHERTVTRSELLEMGFDKKKVDALPAEDDISSTEEQARRDKSDDHREADHDRSQDKILFREAYLKVDWDEDGKSELRQVSTANGKLLSNEEADRQPFHVVSPQPLPHKHFGRATAEKVMDVQLVSSTLLRQTLNNLYHSNQPSHAVWEQGMGENTLDDLLTTRVGSIKRFSRPVSESYQTIETPFTAGASFPMLEYFDKVKRDRTGVASDSEGLTPDALKNIQQSVLMQAVDLSRMKIEAVVRIFAETGVKSLFLHIHELLQKHQNKKDVVQLRNEWVEVNPQEWRTRKNMTVKIGLGIGTREQNLLHLNAIAEKQEAIVNGGGGGVIVTPKNVFNTAAEFVKNANLKDPSKFFTDPGDQPIPQDEGQNQLAQAQLQLAQQQLQLQAREQELDRERDLLRHQAEVAKINQNQEKINQDQQKINNDLLVNLEKISTDLTKLELDSNKDVPGSKV